ncbi:hypothetical protein QQ045_002439 [Rhodiola kirilowii]
MTVTIELMTGKGLKESGDSDEMQVYPKVSKYSEESAWSYSPTKTTSSKKRKKISDDFDKAFEIIKMCDIKSYEVALFEVVASMEENCVGVLDGIHIEAVVLGENHDQYRGRKGVKSWNVLACCSFGILFTYVNASWEGSVNDTTVWKNSINQSKYYFPHLPSDFRNCQLQSGIYENFNYRHSSLRTTIERAFGILKTTWKILRTMPQVSEEWQINIIFATFMLHNFIRMHKLRIHVQSHEEVHGSADSDLLDVHRKAQMNQVRDMIASVIMEVSTENEGEDNVDES